MEVGLVGLPNAGKSTLFSAISSAKAEIADYPFTTISPNVGVVPVPDARLLPLGRIFGTDKTIPATVRLVDIAGLVRGAHKGEGLGNRFLSHIREVDAISVVLRAFEKEDIVHPDGGIDPVRDMETIRTELALSDIERIASRREKVERSLKGSKDRGIEAELLGRLEDWISGGHPARSFEGDEKELGIIASLDLLTAKPVLYVANVSEDDLPGGGERTEGIRAAAGEEGAEVVVVSARIEGELMSLEPDERTEFLSDLGLDGTGLVRFIDAAYRLLDLETFYTGGEKEVRAREARRGTTAARAAGSVHTDMERGFIRAEVIGCDELIEAGSWAAARDLGRIRSEGRDYIVSDGDVVHFLFKV